MKAEHQFLGDAEVSQSGSLQSAISGQQSAGRQPTLRLRSEQATNNRQPTTPPRLWRVIPNFVDTEVFRPARDLEEKKAARRSFGVPEDAFVIGSVAAVKKVHKRIDYLIREFAEYSNQRSEVSGQRSAVSGQQDSPAVSATRPRCGLADPPVAEGQSDSAAGPKGSATPTVRPPPPAMPHAPCAMPFLLLAGSRCPDSEELIALAERLAPGRVRILLDLSRERMPELYRAMDVFVLASLFEMMGIVNLEAMASGLPVVLNRHPVLEWVADTGGIFIDMAEPGAVADALRMMDGETFAQCGLAARERAVSMFSPPAVIARHIAYYGQVVPQT